MIFSVICLILSAVNVFLIVKLLIIQKDIRTIGNEFAEKLKSDTNTVITVSGSDKYVRRFAADLNVQLRILRRQRLKYEQGDLQLKNAVTNISHDLRTPLTAIGGYLALLENEVTGAEAKRYIAILKNRTETLRQLTEELFGYFVNSSPDYGFPKEKVSVNAVLEECLVGSFSALQQAGIAADIKMPENTVYCTSNRTALTRVFSNLINNAIKYSDGDLKVTLSPEGEISFSNSASKLTEIQFNKLFERFYTVESASGSTGLGLSIVKVLLEQTGGTVSADFQDSRLTICVRLPLSS